MSNYAGDNETSQLFIVGSGRSGTTFLASLLKDSRFGVPVESQFIAKYYKKLESYGDLKRKENFSRLVDSILQERSVMQWKLNLNVDSFFDEFSSDIKYADIINKLFLKRPKQISGTAWGDKTPHYVQNLDVISHLFPNAKFIYIVRDGRDVAMSMQKMAWGPSNIYCCAENWVLNNKPSQDIDRLVANGRMLSLHYEDILSDTEMNIRKIYQFLGEEISSERIQEFSKSTMANNCYKWKTILTPKQVQIFESVAGETLSRHGYSVVSDSTPTPSWKKYLYRFHNRLSHYVFLFRINVIDGVKIRFFGAEPFND